MSERVKIVVQGFPYVEAAAAGGERKVAALVVRDHVIASCGSIDLGLSVGILLEDGREEPGFVLDPAGLRAALQAYDRMRSRTLIQRRVGPTLGPDERIGFCEPGAARAVSALYVWSNDVDFYIASSAEHARDLYCAHTGIEPNLAAEYDGSTDSGAHASVWERWPDEKTFTLVEECTNDHKAKPDADPVDVEDEEPEAFTCGDAACEAGMRKTTKTCLEWCADHGEGYLASTDF
jgi:hypothetical protein